MAAPIYRASVAGGSSAGTSDRFVSFTPAVGDLLFVLASYSGNTQTTPTCSDNQGGTYTLIGQAFWNSSADNMFAFVANQLVASAVSHTITIDTDTNTAGQLVAVGISNAPKTGTAAVRSFGSQANQAASTTPAPALNQNCLTRNPTIVAVASADTTTTPPTSWTERQEVGQSTPTTRLEVATRDSGFTGTTITFGATCSTVFASMAIEVEGASPIFATSDGTSTTTGTLVGDGELVGSAAGTSTADGNLEDASQTMAGTADGTSTVTGTLVGTGELTGTSDGTSTSDGVLSATASVEGTSDGTSTATGVLVGEGALVGTAAGTSTASGTMFLDALIGSAEGTSTVTGTLTGTGALMAAVSGIAATTALLVGLGALVASASGSAADSATLTATGALVGSTSGTSTADGDLTEQSQGEIFGLSEGTSTAQGVLVGIGQLAGASFGTSTASLFVPPVTLAGAATIVTTTAAGPTITSTDAVAPNIQSVSISPMRITTI